MKTSKKLISIFLLSFISFIFCLITSNNGIKASDDTNLYTIHNYKMDITVKETNVLYIEETIDIQYHKYIDEMCKRVDKNFTFEYNGKKYTQHALVKNFKSSAPSKSNVEGDDYVGICFPGGTYYNKLYRYKFSYKYNLGPDQIKNIDLFYLPLSNSISLPAPILNFSARITMPKEFNRESIIVHNSLNKYVMVDSLDKTILINQKNIQSNEVISISITLPEDYFNNESYLNENFIDYSIIFIIPIAITLIIFLLWLIKGKEEEPVEVVTFYPPNDLNSYEVGFIYDEKVKNKHIIALIIQLASEGFISIEENGKNDFTIIKLKKYNGRDKCLRNVYRFLFLDNKTQITREELKKNNAITKLKRSMTSHRTTLYDSNKGLSTILLIASPIILFIFTSLYLFIRCNHLSVIFIAIGLAVLAPCNGILLHKNSKASNWVKLLLLFFDGVLLFLQYISMSDILVYTDLTIYAYLTFIICTPISMIFAYHLPKRNEEQTRIYGEILGFRNFLKTAEKDRIDMLIKDDPKYFYNVIPYAYVLDVTDAWIEKFEGLSSIQKDTFTYFFFGTYELD